MATQTLSGLFDTREQAMSAVRQLETAGIPHSDISIVASNGDSAQGSEPADDAEVSDESISGAGTGSSIGSVLGGGAGLLAGLGMLAIPGVGPVVAAGWLVATAVGALAGGVAGGILGALTDAGVSSDHAHVYAEGVRRGGSLVTVRADDAHAATASTVLQQSGAVDPETRRQDYKSSGWTNFDAAAPAYTSEEAEAERDRYRSTTRV